MKMGAEIRTSLARLDHSRNDRKGFTAVDSSDDDDFEPGEVSDHAIKGGTTRRLGHAHIADSDDYSLSRETSFETGLITGSTIITGSTQDMFRTIENPMYVESVGKQVPTFAEQQGDVPVKDECDDEGNYSNLVDERSRLMAAAQAASIPSNDSLSDDSDVDERCVLMAAAIPSNDSFSDDSDVDDRSRLVAAAQAKGIASDDSFSDDSVVDERSRLMAAAQAATIPSNDSFSDDSEDGSPQARSISNMPKIRRELSTRVVPTVAEVHHDSEDLESDENSSFLSVPSDSEGHSTDVVAAKVNSDVQKKSTIGSQIRGYRYRKLSRNSAEPGEEGSDESSNGSEQSDNARRTDVKKPQKWDMNSSSFRAISPSFKWSNVKTKIFYSFRALKASGSSNSDESRTISVRNLAQGVTDDRLHDFFQDSGTILDIWIVRDTQSGLSSAYVEFESGAAARKATQKSGKKLEGRIIMCDTAYENSRGSRSVPRSGHGARRTKSDLSESDTASIKNRVAETQSALKMFDPELHEGDAKFLSRFNEQINFRPYGDIQRSRSSAESVESRSRRGGRLEGSKGKAVLPWTDSYEDSILQSGKNQAELGESVYYDARNLESQPSSSIVGRKIKGSWLRKKVKLTRFLWSWKSARWNLWQLAKRSPSWARRRPTCGCIDTEEKKIARAAKPSAKMRMNSFHRSSN